MLRVLIVEDEKPIREMLNDFLTDEGYDTLMAENGQRGVEIARVERPDLVLMDVMLPLLNGFAAMRALKDDPETQTIPVIVMSANSALLYTQEGKLADQMIRKPFDLDELLRLIQSRIGISAHGGYAAALPG